jgi:hypothetical protein
MMRCVLQDLRIAVPRGFLTAADPMYLCLCLQEGLKLGHVVKELPVGDIVAAHVVRRV